MPAKPWSWPDDARLALSLVVNVEEGAEGSIAEGDRGPEPVDELGIALKKPIRNYGNESNYRYGIKAGAPRVIRLMQAHGVAATFTAAAVALERAPELARDIVAQAHRRLAEVRAIARRTFAEIDALVLPTTPQVAFPFAQPVPVDQADLTGFANMVGIPAGCVPFGTGRDGLPLSVQAMAPAFEDRLVLDLLAALERRARP